jgi:predicted hydrocarbon binding protein
MSRADSAVVNTIMLQALISSEEVMGANGLHAVLRTSGLERFIDHFPPNDLEPSIKSSEYAGLLKSIEEFYGRASKGMMRRIGKASFQYAVREQAALLGLAGVALKLLPQKQRIKFILNSVANALKKTNPNVEAWVEEHDDIITYTEKTCSICWGRQSEQPMCHLYVGSLGEAVLWATGVEHEVVETHCLAKGDEYCRFEIGAPKA